jgi:hypothetical protein
VTLLWSEFANWVGAVGAFATAVIAVVLAVQLRGRERRQALIDLHSSLTSGETADARNVLGTLLHSSKRSSRPDRLAAIDAYFKLIWSIQRARNIFRAHGFHWVSLEPVSKPGAVKRARSKETEAALSWNLREIADNVVMFHKIFSEKWLVEDSDAWEEMRDYLRVSD